MTKILILAGGSGERFWPLSTKQKPKQLLPLITGKSMIRETFDRILNLVNIEDIFISTNEIQFNNLKLELPEIQVKNFIIEPLFKDTAAAILFGSSIIQRNVGGDPSIIVLASDHLIRDVDNFINTLRLATKEAERGYIVTIGIKPTKPETGYGYIKIQENVIGLASNAIEFLEKPDFNTAKKYINDGMFVWNSGMFIFKYSTVINEFNTLLPNHSRIMHEMKLENTNLVSLDLSSYCEPFFNKFEKISIDYGIMEKSKIVKCIPSEFGWNDIGSFNSLEEVFTSDQFGNIVKNAKYFFIDSKNNIVISTIENKIISTIGLENMIIVDTNDALLICNKNDSQKIKDILKLIH